MAIDSLEDASEAALICRNETLISDIVRDILHAQFHSACILLITEFVHGVLVGCLSDAISLAFYNRLASS